MDIVKINNVYALRKWSFIGYVYADREDLLQNEPITWWVKSEIKWAFFDSLEMLESVIDMYSPKIAKAKCDNATNARKMRNKPIVVKKGVKFGSKTVDETLS